MFIERVYISFNHIIMKLLAGNTFRMMSAPRYTFSVLGNQHLSKDAEVHMKKQRTPYLKNTPSLIIPSMQWWSVPEEQASEPLSVWSSKDLRLHAFQNFSQQDHILLLLKEVLMLPSETCMRMIGDGTLTIPSKEVTGSVIKMRFIICAGKHLKLSLN